MTGRADPLGVPASAPPLGVALAPLRSRYATWLALSAQDVLTDRDEAAQDVRAMQLVLRLERDHPPSWHLALALAARGAAALCLDQRAEPGGEWFDAVARYCAGHIRKVTRRARGAQWQATAELPGLTLTDGDAQVRVLLPGPAAGLDRRVSKLQVGGTEVEPDRPAAPGGDGVLVIHLPEEPPMTLGKAMAQAGHAGMIAAALLAGDDQQGLRRWRDAGCPARAAGRTRDFPALLGRLADPGEAWRTDRLLAVRDAGFTEVDPGTVTVIAQAPG